MHDRHVGHRGRDVDAIEGAAWITADGRQRAWREWKDWLGKRAGAGKLAPKGFPATKRFRPEG